MDLDLVPESRFMMTGISACGLNFAIKAQFMSHYVYLGLLIKLQVILLF